VSVESSVVNNDSVIVTAREKITNVFGLFLNYPKTDVEVRATARVTTTQICMIALEPTKSKAVSLQKNSRLTGLGCSIFSNSTNSQGISAEDNAMVDADTVCSAGGIKAAKANFVRAPTTDCPVVADPLANRQPPPVGACDYNKTEIKGGTTTLNPGVYCGGLKITDAAVVTLSPGVYIIQGDKFTVDKGASLEGQDVGFYLAGKDSFFEFAFDSTISLSAPKTGILAGILIFDDRGGKYEKHKIFSNNARTLLGTIYLPNGALYIDSQTPIADKSAYTVLVTRTLELYDGPNLVLNSDYKATSVPTPSGVGPVGARVSLVK
jgi:hypothetical protein